MQFIIRVWESFALQISQFFEEVKLVAADYSLIRDTLDIAMLSYIVYQVIRILRETRAIQLVKGILLIGGLYLFVSVAQLSAMSWLIQRVFELGIIAILIVFQPELRSALERFGRVNVMSGLTGRNLSGEASVWTAPINAICEAAGQLSETKTGALIVIERQTKLGEILNTGVMVDAVPSASLFGNIFFKNSPLHDGAVVMREGKIYAAACFLPKPKHEADIDRALGSRHRAAIGVSEVSDSVTVVVSEENGAISIAVDGRLTRHLTPERLRRALEYYLIPRPKEESKDRLSVFRKGKKNEE